MKTIYNVIKWNKNKKLTFNAKFRKCEDKIKTKYLIQQDKYIKK